MKCLILSLILLVALGESLGKRKSYDLPDKSLKTGRPNKPPSGIRPTRIWTEVTQDSKDTNEEDEIVYPMWPTAWDSQPEHWLAYFREEIVALEESFGETRLYDLPDQSLGKRRPSKPPGRPRPTRIWIEVTQDNKATDKEDVIVYTLLPTASDLQPEQRLAYFREDMGLNLNHWHWHLIFPTGGTRKQVDKDRRGELFYYFHEQMIARYNSERLSHNLSRAVPFEDYYSPIPEAYFPQLDRQISSSIWASRPENQTLSDTVGFNVSSLTLWKERLYEAISSGIMIASNGTAINLKKVNGVDILANSIEISNLAVNSGYYGLFHSAGHVLISRVHDPLGIYLRSRGVMGNTGVAIRDPIFYRWHSSINNLFVDFKKTLPAYSRDELSNPGVTVESVKIVSSNGTNQLLTFWQNATTNLTRGADFIEAHPVMVNLTYLNHVEFQYNIEVTSNASRQATCRIFIAPKYNESGKIWPLVEQKGMFIELDTFVVNLTKGVNNITRLSENSSITIPFNQTFRDLQTNRPNNNDTDGLLKFNYCGCGWPHNLLIPKGNESGVAFELFVMFSNIEQDILTNTTMSLATETDDGVLCKQAYSLCGLRDQLYPDSRSMNYPFDRFPEEETLKEFLLPNMKVVDITIYHKNVTVAA